MNRKELRNELLELGVRRSQAPKMFKVLIKPLDINVLTQRQKLYFRDRRNHGYGAGLTLNYVLKNNLDEQTTWYFLNEYDFNSKVEYNAYVKEIKKIKEMYPLVFDVVYRFVKEQGTN